MSPLDALYARGLLGLGAIDEAALRAHAAQAAAAGRDLRGHLLAAGVVSAELDLRVRAAVAAAQRGGGSGRLPAGGAAPGPAAAAAGGPVRGESPTWAAPSDHGPASPGQADTRGQRPPSSGGAGTGSGGPGRVLPGALPRPGDVVGGYRIERELARGGAGAVFVARADPAPAGGPGVVALKVLLAGFGASATQAERFRREAELGQTLEHPGIVRVVAHGEEGGRAWLAMELLEGARPLDAHAREAGLDAAGRLGLVLRVAEAVAFAHARGVIHRDLKPANVLVLPDGRPKVVDFGLARLLDRERLTASGASLGTPQYMAPEQVKGETAHADARADVWALGVIAWELLTGEVPFVGESSLEVMAKILGEPLPPFAAPGAPAGAEDVLRVALAKDPAGRHASAEAFGRDLAAVLAGRPGSTEAAARLRAGAGQRRRRGLGLALAGALAVVALAAGAWAVRGAAQARARGQAAQALAHEVGRALGREVDLAPEEVAAWRTAAAALADEAAAAGATPPAALEAATRALAAYEGLLAVAAGDRAAAAAALATLEPPTEVAGGGVSGGPAGAGDAAPAGVPARPDASGPGGDAGRAAPRDLAVQALDAAVAALEPDGAGQGGATGGLEAPADPRAAALALGRAIDAGARAPLLRVLRARALARLEPLGAVDAARILEDLDAAARAPTGGAGAVAAGAGAEAGAGALGGPAGLGPAERVARVRALVALGRLDEAAAALGPDLPVATRWAVALARAEAYVAGGDVELAAGALDGLPRAAGAAGAGAREAARVDERAAALAARIEREAPALGRGGPGATEAELRAQGEALARLRLVARLRPGAPLPARLLDPLLEAAAGFRGKGDLELGLALAALAPDDLRVQRDVGLLSARQKGEGRVRALGPLRRAIELEPDAEQRRLYEARLCAVLSKSGGHDECLTRSLPLLVELPPGELRADVLVSRGRSLRLAGRPADALPGLDEAHALAPANADVRLERALARAGAGLAEGALDDALHYAGVALDATSPEFDGAVRVAWEHGRARPARRVELRAALARMNEAQASRGGWQLRAAWLALDDGDAAAAEAALARAVSALAGEPLPAARELAAPAEGALNALRAGVAGPDGLAAARPRLDALVERLEALRAGKNFP